jgi:hypothetical protein
LADVPCAGVLLTFRRADSRHAGAGIPAFAGTTTGGAIVVMLDIR